MSHNHDDIKLLENLSAARERIFARWSRVIIGQKNVLDELLITILADGHTILVGVPGLAKTLIVRTLASLIDFKFGRIQFTPDLMPADIIGTEMIQEKNGSREIIFQRGAIFCNLLLADEINRTPPRTQAALLEAMQECQVTVAGNLYPLPQPFCVIATRNPIELEGTYPLPEAQRDRFLLSIEVPYPQTLKEEMEIALAPQNFSTVSVRGDKDDKKPIWSIDEVTQFQKLVQRIPIAQHLLERVARVVRSSRPESAEALPIVKQNLRLGISPRAAQHWVLAAKAHAALGGNPTVTENDLRRTMFPVLRHRLVFSYAACVSENVLGNVSAEEMIETMMNGSGE